MSQNPWVQIIGGPKAAPFGYLAIGERFHHPNFPDDVMVKTSKRSYKDARGHRWTGSAGQAVVPVKNEPSGGKKRHVDGGKKKYHTCPECEANFKLGEGESFPPHRAFRGVGLCPGSGTGDGVAKLAAEVKAMLK